jgi:hypothetical protein
MMWSNHSGHCAGADEPHGWLRRRRGQLCLLACCAALAIAAGAGLLRGHAQSAPASATPDSEKVAGAPTPAAGQQENQPTGNAPDDPQKQQIASECADLLKMATDLKSEVGKTTKDTLSVKVVRKASEIEQLAHKVRTGSPKG